MQTHFFYISLKITTSMINPNKNSIPKDLLNTNARCTKYNGHPCPNSPSGAFSGRFLAITLDSRMNLGIERSTSKIAGPNWAVTTK
jgi:hypothetical protein